MSTQKEYLINLISEAVDDQIKNDTSRQTVDHRLIQLERYKLENNLALYEVLEDILEQIDNKTWKEIIKGLNYKYGHIG